MNLLKCAVASIGLGLLVSASAAEPPAPTMSASELAARLGAVRADGSSYIRLRLQPAGAGVLQLQVKSRSSKGAAELVYQVLWPKERKGEAILLRRTGGRISGTHFIPPDQVHPLTSTQIDEPLFGSDLSCEDVIDDFFAWSQQAIVGNEVVDRAPCTILESKPGKGDHSSYSSVRTWVDTRRLVPLRVEKYGSPGRVVRRIDTTRVATDDKGRSIPANLTVRGPRGSVTEVDGSRINHGVTFSDAEFAPEGLKDLTVPRGTSE